MKSKMTILLSICSVFFIFSITGVSAAADSKVIELKYANNSPQTQLVNYAPNLWLKELEKRAGGRVKVTTYYGGVLGKVPETINMLNTGMCNMSTIPIPVFSGMFPMSDVTSLPFFISDLRTSQEMITDLYDKGLLDKEYSKIKLLWFQAVYAVNPMFRNKKVNKLEDLKGMKIRVMPGAPGKTMKALGATPVSMHSGDVYTALERGTVDGTITTPDWFDAVKLYEVTKYYLWAPVAGGVHATVMSLKYWNSLPPDIQAIMEELSKKAANWHVEESERVYSELVEKIKAKSDAYSLAPEELERWKKATAGVIDEWTSEMDAKGYPARDVVKEAKKFLENR